MRIGYARVSTEEQNLDLQRRALNAAGVDRIHEDRVSGLAVKRPGLEAALASLGGEDTLVDWLRDLYAHSRPRGWEDRFEHAIRDPLLLFATQLTREAVLALDERLLAWPADLRRPWTYAAAAAAIGGYVS